MSFFLSILKTFQNKTLSTKFSDKRGKIPLQQWNHDNYPVILIYGWHDIDALDIMADMKQYFDESESIPVYINMIEAAQKKAARAKLPISDDMLVAIATKVILVYGVYPTPPTPGKRIIMMII